jgi:hypothetical protein
VPGILVPICLRVLAILHSVIGEIKNMHTEEAFLGFGNLKFLSITMLIAISMKHSLETLQCSSDFLALLAALQISSIPWVHKLGSTEILSS